ncbi:chemotaxis protein CheD [Halorientalis persicus]|jgi:chemotaxis protein CheD|uniref:Probable chemoreceptor glutamine deamidase CheD n=1 Tax=Halorientalis persicus TaxID=1367881 RepID=A0A1H8NUV3_9EURY|nr:chemotaxis protein CheD [Halorientalis persicus]SEO33302.1 chemotaxis protein CheD [Halorientalis persicus]
MKVYDSSSETASSPEQERVKVGIAEYEVTTSDATLTTSGLGSCLGVALYDDAAGVAGLVHVMLPSADGVEDPNAAKYADTGIETLLLEMERAGASRASIRAKVAGGSDMLDFSENGSGIGVRNMEQVEATLDDLGVPLVSEDVGGDHGRSLRLDGASGELTVKSANKGSKTI